MRKKFAVKIIATVMAMAMVFGSGMTVLAESGESGTCKGDYWAFAREYISKLNNPSESYNATKIAVVPADINTLPEGKYYTQEGLDTFKAACVAVFEHTHVGTIPEDSCVEMDRIYNNMTKARDNFLKRSDGSHYSSEDSGACEHTFSGPWYVTPCTTMHYQKCSKCGGELLNSQLHTFGSDGKCTVCGYSKPSSQATSQETKAPIAEDRAEEAAKVIEATVAAEVAAPVTTFTSAEAVNAIPAEAKTTGAAYNLSSVTTTQGFVAAVNKISKDTASKTMSVYSSKPITMNSASIEAVTSSGKAFEYTFSYMGHIYKITIPAGAKINMNGQRFAGPLYIGAILGTTQVIK